MPITLYHHPMTRAANVVWMLEEVGVEYALRYVDLEANEQKSAEVVALNPMGKLPVLVDGDVVVTESAAIALSLGDRYGYGSLAPRVDEPARGAYLRWTFYAPSVIEPGSLANASKWEYRAGQAGWGTPDAMLATIAHAIGAGPFLLGERFTMADIVFGNTVRWMLRAGMLEKRSAFTSYVERIDARPAWQRASTKNAAIRAEHGLG
jgi:glutathione S-transferase